MSDQTDAVVLAVWCERSTTSYSTGARQTALLLRGPDFCDLVAAELARLSPAHPALPIWQR